MSEQAVIKAVSRGVMATLVDGTIRVKIDIEPADAELAFKLLGMPGNPVAIARLLSAGESNPAPSPEPVKPKGGPLAKLAGMWCAEPEFADWLADCHPLIFEGALQDANGDVEEAAKRIVCSLCGIESRIELDHAQYAADLFHERIRQPYMAHLERAAA